jgi:hypothetical protein
MLKSLEDINYAGINFEMRLVSPSIKIVFLLIHICVKCLNEQRRRDSEVVKTLCYDL